MQNQATAQEKIKKYFTVDSANKMLPLVRSIATDLVTKFRDLNDLRARLEVLQGSRREALTGPHREEVEAVECDFDKIKAELCALLEELRELGVECKGPDGLVDFPAIVDDREVCLCWKVGELEVKFWHETNAGFPGRRPLTQAMISDREDRA